jgi:hypothetical protein
MNHASMRSEFIAIEVIWVRLYVIQERESYSISISWKVGKVTTVLTRINAEGGELYEASDRRGFNARQYASRSK